MNDLGQLGALLAPNYSPKSAIWKDSPFYLAGFFLIALPFLPISTLHYHLAIFTTCFYFIVFFGFALGNLFSRVQVTTRVAEQQIDYFWQQFLFYYFLLNFSLKTEGVDVLSCRFTNNN